MRSPLVCLFALLMLAGVAGAQKTATAPNAPAPAITVIKAGTLIDPAAPAPRHGMSILIRGNRIESVAEGATAAPAGATVIDLSRATVLPGMIEAHTHIFLQGEDPAEGGYDGNILYPPVAMRAVRAAVAARWALEQGFTTIRDMGTEGAGYGDVGIKRAIEKGYIPGPRIFASTLGISTTGGYPLEGYAPEIQDRLPKGVQIGDGPTEFRKIAREQLDKGADLLKVYMTHRSWVGKKGELVSQPTLTVDELKAIVEEAHGWGKKVACHAYGGVGLHRALDGGCDSIEHGLDLDDAAVAQMKRQGTWLIPTMSVYYDHNAPPNTPAGQRDLARINAHKISFQKAYKAGIKMAFGTDVGGFSWSDPIAPEFTRMVELGMAPADALRMATINAAELLEMQGQIGVIAAGAYADIIAVSVDPLKDIGELGRVKFVMKDGKVFKNQF